MLRQRIVGIMGKSINEKLVPVEEDTDILQVSGFVTKPSFSKKKRGEQFLFVNDRFIKSPYLHHAVMAAFEGLLNPGYHPSYFLYLRVPPKSIDVNIHPTKTEVKFDNDRDLYAIIRSTVKHSLGQYNVVPSLDFDRDSSLDTPYAFKNRGVTSSPTIQVDQNYNPFKESSGGKKTSFIKEGNSKWESLYVENDSEKELIQHIDVEVEHISQQLFDESKEEILQKTFQVQGKYIASSIKSGMVLIDQNAAHQRILYEDYLAKVTLEGISHQQLLFPLKITLNKNDIALIENMKADLQSTGFSISKIQMDSIVLDAIPHSIREDEVSSIIESLIENFRNEVPDAGFSQIDIITKSLAKSLAIQSGAVLNAKEQEHILNKLFSCKEPNYSPFGKKTYITLSLEELENKFNKS